MKPSAARARRALAGRVALTAAAVLLAGLGWRGTGAERSLSWRCTLARGSYRVAVFATDQAGNRQAAAGSARLTVR